MYQKLNLILHLGIAQIRETFHTKTSQLKNRWGARRVLDIMKAHMFSFVDHRHESANKIYRSELLT